MAIQKTENTNDRQPVSAFLQLANVKGESTDQNHKEWIEIYDYEDEVVQPRSATGSTTGGATASRSVHSTKQFKKAIDIASTSLWQNSASGTTLATARFEFERADKDGNRVTYLVSELLNVVVHRVATGVGPEGMPIEIIELAYGSEKRTYTAQKPGGGAGGKTVAQWSQMKNAPTHSA